MGLSEKNPGLDKQNGCMTGFFQVFDRHHFTTGRRFIGHSSKRLPSGQSPSSTSTSYTEEHTSGSPQIILEYNPKKSSKESRRMSVESSPISPFSSLEGSKATKPKSSDIETKSPRNGFRDVVKDSIGAETRVLTVKTSVSDDLKKENVLRHRDSPRPIMSVDLTDSLWILTLKGASSDGWEGPRFSCDGREISRSKSSTKLRELPRSSLDSRDGSLRSSNYDTQYNEMGRSSPNRGIPSVLAKLMGLESMPDSPSQRSMEMTKYDAKKSRDQLYEDGENNHVAHSRKSPPGSSESQTPKNAVTASKQGSKRTESVYSQIDRRVKELEFSHSNKDLRALKHILDTMQAKGMLESKGSNGLQSEVISQKNQDMEPFDRQNPRMSPPRAFNSPIVIMKPARSIKKSHDLEGLSGLRRLRTGDSTNRMKANDQAPKANAKETDDINVQKSRIPHMQRSPRPQQPVKERSGKPVKSLSVSRPSAQQRKLEQNKPRPSTLKHNIMRKPLDPVLPNGNLRVKRSQAEMNGQQGRGADEISKREDANISLATQANEELTNDDCTKIVYALSQQQENLKTQNEDSSSIDSAIISMEHPSPVSVLKAAFYQDELPLSPATNILSATEDDEIQTSPEGCRKLSAKIHLQKIYGIKNLVERLRQLSLADEANTHEPSHDHVSQILLSAGILSNGLTSGTIHLLQSNTERLHQELMFDAVKEVLTRKLELISKQRPQHNVFRLAKKLSWQHLLAEICSEIKQLLLNKPFGATLEEEEEEDMPFREDLLRQSDGWDDYGLEVAGLVLDIERSMFKDLIDEIVSGEACSKLRVKANKRMQTTVCLGGELAYLACYKFSSHH